MWSASHALCLSADREYCKSHKVSSSFILVCLVVLAIGASLLK